MNSTSLPEGAVPPSVVRRAAAIPIVAILAFVAIAWMVGLPYQIHGDAAYQTKSVVQWLAGDSTSFNAVAIPAAADLSEDLFLWSTAWGPGLAAAVIPALAAGLPIGWAVRLTCTAFFVLGVVAWSRLCRALPLSRRVIYAFFLLFVLRGLTSGGVSQAMSGDPLVFGVLPWLILATFRRTGVLAGDRQPTPSVAGDALLAVALGSLFWLKYSAYVGATGLMLWFAWARWRRPPPRRSKLAVAALLLACFSLPAVALVAVNESRSNRFRLNIHEPLAAQIHDWRWVATIPGSIGANLLQATALTNHIALFSDLGKRVDRVAPQWSQTRLKALLGLPGALLLAWAIWRARTVLAPRLAAAATVTMLVPFAALAAITWQVGHDFVAYSERYVSPYFPLIDLIVLAALDRYFQFGPIQRAATTVTALALAGLPALFAAALFTRQDVVQRFAYRATGDDLYTPQLSRFDSRAVVETAGAAAPSTLDVTVVATPDGGTPFSAWLAFPGRSLPLGYYIVPNREYGPAALIESDVPFLTSRPLRVVLVVSDYIVQSPQLEHLMKRFPQADGWRRVEGGAADRVSIFETALVPARAGAR